MWNNFPYSDYSDLNMDWVLNVVKEAENVIRNINGIVATYVDNMTTTLRYEIEAGNNRSMQYARGVEYRIESKMNKLKGDVNRRVYEAEMFMRKTYADIVAENDKTENTIKDELLKNRNEREADKRKIWNEIGKTLQTVDNDISMLKTYVQNEIDDFKQYVNAKLDDERHKTDRQVFHIMGRMDDLQMEIEDVQAWVNRTLDFQWNRVDAILEQYRIEFNNALEGKADNDKVDVDIARLEEAIKNINVNTSTVHNPVTNTVTDIDTALSDIWNGHERIWSITAGEYDALGITAEKYDKMHLTACEYDYLSRWFLVVKPQLIKHFHRDIKREIRKVYDAMEKMHDAINARVSAIENMVMGLTERMKTFEKKLYDETHMISPISGITENIKDVIRELVGEVQRNNSLTAAAYDALQVTAGEYDSLNITAYRYDWQGRSINWT